jgi:hypothetical protein
MSTFLDYQSDKTSLSSEISLLVFVSWQWRCNACKLVYISLPPFDLGIMWSTSIKSSSLKYNSQWAHLPCCFFKSVATLFGTRGCLPLLELQYFRFPSNGDAVPLTLICLTIVLLAWLIRVSVTFPSLVTENTQLFPPTVCQYFLDTHIPVLPGWRISDIL